MQVNWQDEAKENLDSILVYIATKESIDKALSVIDDLEAEGDKIGKMPYIARKGRVENTREWVSGKYPNYIIVYEINEQKSEIDILNVIHAKRDYPFIE